MSEPEGDDRSRDGRHVPISRHFRITLASCLVTLCVSTALVAWLGTAALWWVVVVAVVMGVAATVAQHRSSGSVRR